MVFRLMQRGKFNSGNIDEFDSINGDNGLIYNEYMGSFEFETTRLPKSFRRIMGQYGDYIVIDSGIKNRNGVPLQVFCNSKHKEEVLEELQTYVKENYPLKEYSGLRDHFTKAEYNQKGEIYNWCSVSTNFWWCIDMGCDFMMFFGAQDRVELFTSVLDKDYNNWWMAKDAKTREDEFELSFNN